MTAQACGLCSRDPAAGFATINGRRYCHGDFDSEPTCYMRAQWRRPLSPADHEAREGERRYESWLESLKDHGP